MAVSLLVSFMVLLIEATFKFFFLRIVSDVTFADSKHEARKKLSCHPY